MSDSIDLLLLAATGVSALGWLAGFAALFRIPAIRPTPGSAEPLRLSVIIPARNEERRLEPLLTSLAGQLGDGVDLIVVDDQSTDGTAELARSFGARVISAGPRPEGWTGKNWACHQGALAASGDPLLFLDADTRLLANGLARLVATWRTLGGVLSVQPYHRVVRHYEQLSAFFNLIVMIGVDAFGLFSRRGRPAGAFGPCFLCARRDYFAVGGHKGIRGHVVDDMALAAQFAGQGIEIFCFGGRGAVDFQMYPEGRASLEEGWTKNLSTAAGMSARKSVVLLACWMTGMFTAVFLVLFAAFGFSGSYLGLALGIYAAYVLQVFFQLRRVGSFRFDVALLFPFYLAYFQHLFARSVYHTRVHGSVRWKGRDISVNR